MGLFNLAADVYSLGSAFDTGAAVSSNFSVFGVIGQSHSEIFHVLKTYDQFPKFDTEETEEKGRFLAAAFAGLGL